jgi:hypothetical protein
MSSLNDPELTHHLRVVLSETLLLNELALEGRSEGLITVLAKVEDAARQAQWRLIDLTRGRDKKAAVAAV